VRVEDIDPPRAKPGASDAILRELERFGLEWDGPVSYQSGSRLQHDRALEQLAAQGATYECGCSRRDLEVKSSSSLGPIYPGTCREGTRARVTALRVRTDNRLLTFDDLIQGKQQHHLERESGDFVVLRKDRLIAYQLAVVVDDHLQGVTEVVRGIDLMDSTPRQIWLQQLLGYETPVYAHIPIAVDDNGRKLSKSHGAPPVAEMHAVAVLFAALQFLDQEPPPALRHASLNALLDWAIDAWNIDRLRGKTERLTSENLYHMPKSGAVKKP